MRAPRALIVLTALAFAVAAPLGAGAAADSSGVQPTGSIEGKIFDTSGQLLGGICVQVWDSGWQLAGSGRTGLAGSYLIDDVNPGTYTVEYRDCGSASSPNVQAQFYDNTQDWAASTPVTVTAGQAFQADDQTMQPGGEIDLTLTDPNGAPVTGVNVQITAVTAPQFLTNVGYAMSTPDTNGTVKFMGLLKNSSYTLEYELCPDLFCAPIGYYRAQSWDGTPTAIPAVPGEIISETDVLSVPPVTGTTTTVVVSPISSTLGESVTLTAKVTADDGSVPEGTIDFADGSDSNFGASFGTAVLGVDGAGSVTAELPLGTTTVTAYYFPRGPWIESIGSATATVEPVGGGGGGGGTGGGGGAAPVTPPPVSGTVGAGGSLSSDPSGVTPDQSNPLVVDVTTPAGGSISIDKTPPNTSITGYKVLNVGATITAPQASTSEPLKLTFQVYDGTLPAGYYDSDLTVFRDGNAVGACSKPGVADPDPCRTSSSTKDGVTTITVLSSHASTWDVEAADVGRIGGADRIATAVDVSQASFPTGNAGAVVLARADDYPDALVGAPLAAAKKAPLLLTQGSALPSATEDEIVRVLPKGQTVYVLGGTTAVPDSVVTQLTGDGYNVVRYGGKDRFATAVAVADALGDPQTVLLATGTNFPDALAAGPAAAHVGGVVLLTNATSLPTATSDYLAAHATTVYAVGGPAAAADPNATPVFGADRFGTAEDVATTFFSSPTTVGLATSTTFPDALSGGAQLALAGAPLLLLPPQSPVAGPTKTYLTNSLGTLTTAHLYGGSKALADSVLAQVRTLLGG